MDPDAPDEAAFRRVVRWGRRLIAGLAVAVALATSLVVLGPPPSKGAPVYYAMIATAMASAVIATLPLWKRLSVRSGRFSYWGAATAAILAVPLANLVLSALIWLPRIVWDPPHMDWSSPGPHAAVRVLFIGLALLSGVLEMALMSTILTGGLALPLAVIGALMVTWLCRWRLRNGSAVS